MSNTMFVLLAIPLGAIVYYALGAVWFSVLFGKVFIKNSGHTEEEIKNMPKKRVIISFVVTFFLALVKSFLLFALYNPMMIPLQFTLQLVLIILVFIALEQMDGILWGKDSWAYYFVKIGYPIVGYILMLATFHLLFLIAVL